MAQERWFDRVFPLGQPLASLPELVDRLRSAPDRVTEAVRGLPADVVTWRDGDAWSIAEQVGHLGDLEPLWTGRVDDLLAGLPDLRPADLENTATWSANHNACPIDELLDAFREQRGRFVARLEGLSDEELSVVALHPRLKEPMTIVDLCYFVAEHDDHHVAAIEALRAAGG